jgi:glycosyltransferase involved in cell wall biosynthesis
MTLVSPSRWLASCTSLSPLLKDKPLEVIPNGLDTDMFKPADRSVSRELLGLPQEKRLLLFGALSPLATEIKGFHFLKPALVEVFKHIQPDFLELIIVGASEPREPIDLGIPVRYMGRLHDDISLRLAYSAADVTVLPSIQEVFGQMASESLACGTPVVAFSGTGIADVIDHGENGYLATAYDESDLGRGIIFILNHPDRTSLQHSARSKAMREFSLPIIAERYRSLYRQVLQQNLRDYGPGKPSMTRAGDII